MTPGAVVIVGATSSIGRALAERFALGGSPVILAARDVEEAGHIAADLRVRTGVEAEAVPFDAERLDDIPAFFDRCLALCDEAPGGLIVVHGVLGSQERTARDAAEIRRLIDVNFTSGAATLALFANHFESRGGGFLAAVCSVAGDRGRQSNYTYGAAKAGLAAYMSGLRQRLAKRGVAVLTVKPGFVDTQTTYGMKGLFLVASPEMVASDIVRAIRRGRSEIYTPWFWRIIMLIIRSIPEPVFKRLKL